MSKARFVGEEVEAVWSGDSAFYGATIEAFNEIDGTYSVLFDDGEKESNVREQDIRDRGLMTPSSSSDGFEDDDDTNKKNKKVPVAIKKQAPKKNNPKDPS